MTTCEGARKLFPQLITSHLTFRSEEHTSELQSQSNLVCRLLLETNRARTDRFHLVDAACGVIASPPARMTPRGPLLPWGTCARRRASDTPHTYARSQHHPPARTS